MNTYSRKQHGAVILNTVLGMAVIFLLAGSFLVRPLLISVPLLLLAAWLFSSLTIEIDERDLRWSFGPGLIRKSVPLNEIASVRPVRTNFMEGWGIHLSRFGWLYNVSGWDAVAITLRTGKSFALGTDQPHDLIAAINAARGLK